MTTNHKIYWILGSIALIGASYLLRKKAAEMWHHSREERESMPMGT